MTEPNNNPPPPDPASAPAPAPGASSTAAPGGSAAAPQAPPPYTQAQGEPPQPIPYATPSAASGVPPYLGPAATQDDRNMATIAHILGIFTSFVGPLIIWLVKKDQSPYVDDQGKEALNFQLTLLIGYVISAVATIICIGPIIALALSVIAIVFGIMAAVASSKGEAYRYPVNIRFIK